MSLASQWLSRPRRNPPSETGFDSWLNRSLRASYGDVAQEKVPAELLDLILQNTQKH